MRGALRHEVQAAAGSPHVESPRARRRAGAVLVFFAMLSFVLMGIAALVIDLGIARLTQSRMQTASDGMALEVLRERDLRRDPPSAADDYRRDQRRRQRNARIGGWHYMPHLHGGNPGGLEDTHGAGAYIDMVGGMIGHMDASKTIVDAGFSIPRPRLNYRSDDAGEPVPLNLPHGDIVSGSYTGHRDVDDDGLEDGAIGYGGNPFHLEGAQYERVDFVPAKPIDAPYPDSVLARLRRTARPSDSSLASALDNTTDVASSGPTLPFLFGLGTTMHGGDPMAGYSPRHHGIGVRATAIAQALPAVRIGMAHGNWETETTDDGNGIGAAPLVISKQIWNREVDADWQSVDGVNHFLVLRYVNGVLTCDTCDGQWAGYFQHPRVYRLGDRVNLMADALSEQFWLEPKNWEVEEAYAPIVRRGLSTPWSDRVVGFARIKTEFVMVADASGELEPGMRLWKLGDVSNPDHPPVAPRNASAVFDGEQVSAQELSFDIGHGQSVWSWERIMRELHGRRDPDTGEWLTRPVDRALRAPALVR